MSSNLKIRYNFSRKKKPFKAESKAQRKDSVSKFAGGKKLSVLRRCLKEVLPKKAGEVGRSVEQKALISCREIYTFSFSVPQPMGTTKGS